ncbi:MAG: hypothetical protein ACTSV5_11595 [Promethearchaeota archaeon]
MLEPLEMFSGILSLTFVVISLIVALMIISKYIKVKSRVFLFVGLTWIGLTSPWLPSSIAFITYLTTGSGLVDAVYFAIGNVASPFILIIWISAFLELKERSNKKFILLAYVIVGILYEIYLVSFLIVDPSVIGALTSVLDVTYRGLVLIWALFLILNLIVTGIILGRESLKSDNAEIKWKGKFLLAAFISMSVGAIMDAALPLNLITLIIARLILISSAFEFYLGFILPNFMKKLLIKE